MREVTLRGLPENIAKAEEVISTVVKTKSVDCIIKLQSSREGYEKVSVPNDKIGLVIGKGGIVIKELMSKTGTQISIPHEPERENPEFRSIIVTGEPDRVLEAKRLIHEIVDGQMGAIPPGIPTTTYNIPDDKVGLVIGKGGTIIKDIQLKSKAYIMIPGKPVAGSNPPVRYFSIFIYNV